MPPARVAVEAMLQPDHLGDREVVGQHRCRRLARQAGVAPRIEHRGDTDQAGALAVDVQTAPLEHDRGSKARHVEPGADRFGQPGVLIERRRPPAVAVEAPVDPRHRAGLIDHEGGPGVAEPGVVVVQRQDRDALAALHRGVGGQLRPRDHGDRLVGQRSPSRPRPRPARRRHAVAPELGPARPSHPAARVRRPLGRHGEALRAGCGHGRPPRRLPIMRVPSTSRFVDPLRPWRVAAGRVIVRARPSPDRERRVRSAIERRLAARGLELPDAPAPAANYVPYTISGKLLLVAGQLPFRHGPGGGQRPGRRRREPRAGSGGGPHLRAQPARPGQGRMRRRSGPSGALPEARRLRELRADFAEHPAVINGASDLMVEAMGEAGRHARFAVGCASLPRGAAVEVEAIFELA